MAGNLTVWMYGEAVATIERDARRRLRLSYTDQALESFTPGTPLLSLRMPLSNDRFTHGTVSPFLEGLLPEGEPRRLIAEELGVASGDTFALISALGRDCAGALVIQPEEDGTPSTPTTLSAEPLSEEELEHLVANLRGAPLGVGPDVRLSLAGVQEKLVLTRMPGGSWGRPVNGTPSTHILKPELPEYPNTVENEAFCMRFAKHLGVETATVDEHVVGTRKLLVVERFDRAVGPGGTVERIHQEDFCQALGVLPSNKYEERGGPTLKQIAAALEAFAAAGALEKLLRAAVVNVLVGNCDAHGKNFSLLHERTGALRLAPMYDVLSTEIYGERRLSMYVAGVQRLERVTSAHIIAEAEAWGLAGDRARAILREMLGAADDATLAARDETAGVPPQLIHQVRAKAKQLAQDLH